MLCSDATEGLTLFECNARCSCCSSDEAKCPNRVVQRHGGMNRDLPLYLVLEGNEMGWGARSQACTDGGTYLGEYMGRLLGEEEATEEHVRDEYLAVINHTSLDALDVEDLRAVVLEQQGIATVEEFLDKMPRVTVDAMHCGNFTRCQLSQKAKLPRTSCSHVTITAHLFCCLLLLMPWFSRQPLSQYH
jgi:hypothetical protein